MTDFGRFRLSYEPGKHDPYSGVLDHSVEMTISGEAELQNLTDFFTCFLRASGYLFDGKIAVIPESVKYPQTAEDVINFGVA